MKRTFSERGLIVSCQALPGEPLFGGDTMVKMALAAERAGAIGIRTNGVEDIRRIRQAVRVPVIGLLKRDIPGSDVFITPELEDVEAVIEAGADIVALDVTDREQRLQEAARLIERAHAAGVPVMADISSAAEGKEAERLGADYVSTTLSGYTPYSPQQEGVDIELVRALSACVSVPVVAEGRIWSPEEAAAVLEAGATYVVVGSAITRPQLITQRYVEHLKRQLAK